MIPHQGGLELKLYPTTKYSSLIFTDKGEIKSKHRKQRDARYWINKRNKKRKKKK